MSPLNHLMNCSAELADAPNFFSKNISSRFLNTLCIPLEILAVLQNSIKLPFQAVALTVKIPAKIINIAVSSKSLYEFESKLAGPLDLIKTILKIAGYAIGCLFSVALGTLSPYKNFQLHSTFGLIDNHKVERRLRKIEENRQQQILSHEAIIETRIKLALEAMRKKAQPQQFLRQEQAQEIELQTHVPCPPLQEILKEVPLVEIKEISSEPLSEDPIVPISTAVEEEAGILEESTDSSPMTSIHLSEAEISDSFVPADEEELSEVA